MEVLQPTGLTEALEMKRDHPEAVPLAGGTDLMVELNFDRRRPEAILDLTRVPELVRHGRADGRIEVGAGVTYTTLIQALAAELPGLAIASRTVGSPQIRNRGTVGGNLGTCSPAGDTLPVLEACNAEIKAASTRGARTFTMSEFMTGVKQNALADDELIVSFSLPAARGPQQYSKIGTRNAMVIAVATFAIALDAQERGVRTGVGSAAPTIVRARSAEDFALAALDEGGLWDSRAELPASLARRFGELAAEVTDPIDDVRGTAAYRKHAVSVMAARTLTWVWDDYRRGDA